MSFFFPSFGLPPNCDSHPSLPNNEWSLRRFRTIFVFFYYSDICGTLRSSFVRSFIGSITLMFSFFKHSGFLYQLELNNIQVQNLEGEYSKVTYIALAEQHHVPTLHLDVEVFDCCSLAYDRVEDNKKTAATMDRTPCMLQTRLNLRRKERVFSLLLPVSLFVQNRNFIPI